MGTAYYFLFFALICNSTLSQPVQLINSTNWYILQTSAAFLYQNEENNEEFFIALNKGRWQGINWETGSIYNPVPTQCEREGAGIKINSQGEFFCLFKYLRPGQTSIYSLNITFFTPGYPVAINNNSMIVQNLENYDKVITSGDNLLIFGQSIGSSFFKVYSTLSNEEVCQVSLAETDGRFTAYEVFYSNKTDSLAQNLIQQTSSQFYNQTCGQFEYTEINVACCLGTIHLVIQDQDVIVVGGNTEMTVVYNNVGTNYTILNNSECFDMVRANRELFVFQCLNNENNKFEIVQFTLNNKFAPQIEQRTQLENLEVITQVEGSQFALLQPYEYSLCSFLMNLLNLEIQYCFTATPPFKLNDNSTVINCESILAYRQNSSSPFNNYAGWFRTYQPGASADFVYFLNSTDFSYRSHSVIYSFGTPSKQLSLEVTFEILAAITNNLGIFVVGIQGFENFSQIISYNSEGQIILQQNFETSIANQMIAFINPNNQSIALYNQTSYLIYGFNNNSISNGNFECTDAVKLSETILSCYDRINAEIILVEPFNQIILEIVKISELTEMIFNLESDPYSMLAIHLEANSSNLLRSYIMANSEQSFLMKTNGQSFQISSKNSLLRINSLIIKGSGEEEEESEEYPVEEGTEEEEEEEEEEFVEENTENEFCLFEELEYIEFEGFETYDCYLLAPSLPTPAKKENKLLIIGGIGLMVVLVIVISVIICKKRKQRVENQDLDISLQKTEHVL